MKYVATCPICGKKFFKAEEGSEIEMQCPNCKEQVNVVVISGTVISKCLKVMPSKTLKTGTDNK